MKQLKYLITGTGRCGTVYMARLFTEMGITCGHESIFDYWGIEIAKKRLEEYLPIQTSAVSRYNPVSQEKNEEWFDPANLLAESSYMAAPYLNDPILADTKIIHLMRHPLKVLSSWVSDIHFFDGGNKNKVLDKYREFIHSHLPQIRLESTEVEKACRYLIEWNKIIEKCNQEKIVVKIENYPYLEMMNFLNKSNLNLEKIEEFKNKKINSWETRSRNLSLRDIPEGNTKEEFIYHINKYEYNHQPKILC